MATLADHSATILLGATCRTINPPPGLPLLGYPNPQQRRNTGVALDLCARAAVFGTPQSPAPRAALVVLDTLGVNPHVVQRIRQAAAAQLPGLAPDAILVAATHTHSAPTLCARQFGPQDMAPATAYVDHAVVQAAAALAAAWPDRAPVAVRCGRTEVRLGHNRRVVDAAGRATNVWLDPDGRHTGFCNPSVRFLVFEDVRTHQPRALFSLYGCHPVTLGPGNTQVSADYPGHFARAVEAALPGCHAFHLTGGAGNINPRQALAANPDQARPAGVALAQAVLDELPHARPVSPTPLATCTESLALPLGPDAHQNYSGRATDSLDGQTIISELQVLRLGAVALISTPGELFAELALAIENTSPFATTFVLGYGNDNLGYLFTDAARREGGYEAQAGISHQIEQRLLPAARAALDRAMSAG